MTVTQSAVCVGMTVCCKTDLAAACVLGLEAQQYGQALHLRVHVVGALLDHLEQQQHHQQQEAEIELMTLPAALIQLAAQQGSVTLPLQSPGMEALPQSAPARPPGTVPSTSGCATC